MVDGLLVNGKIADSLLPAYVFGGMRMVSYVNSTTHANTALLLTDLDTFIGTNGGSRRGCYYIYNADSTVLVSSGHRVHTPTGAYVDQGESYTVQSGDWLVAIIDAGTEWAIVNNEYGLANASNKGLMSAAHYTKLEGIASGANNYTHPSQTAIDTNATDDGISVIDRVTVNTLGHVTAVTTRNLAAATTSTPGHMTAAQASKLAGIDDNANNYSHPTGGANVNISASTIETIASVVVNTLGHTTAFTKQTIRSASTSQTGIVELATDAEMKAGSSGTLVGTAASVKAAIDFFATLPVYANLTAANTDAPNQPTGKLALVIV